MNKELMKLMGFEEEVKLIEEGKCPFCKRPVKIDDFDDEISKKEFKLSGLCKKCMDNVFK